MFLKKNTLYTKFLECNDKILVMDFSIEKKLSNYAKKKEKNPFFKNFNSLFYKFSFKNRNPKTEFRIPELVITKQAGLKYFFRP